MRDPAAGLAAIAENLQMTNKKQGRVLGHTLSREQAVRVAGGLDPVECTPAIDGTYAGYDIENSFASTDSNYTTNVADGMFSGDPWRDRSTTPYY